MSTLTLTTSQPPAPPADSVVSQHWRPRTSRTSRTSQTFSRETLEQHFGGPQTQTLTASASNAAKIARILVFDNQHPDFPREILVKSNLQLVFDVPLQTLQVTAVPLFRQVPVAISGGRDRWEFGGWYVIDAVHCIEKGSAELSKRLEDKWSKRGRSLTAGGQWQQGGNLEVDWAAVMLRKVSDKDCPLADATTPTPSAATSPPAATQSPKGANGESLTFSPDTPRRVPPPSSKTPTAGTHKDEAGLLILEDSIINLSGHDDDESEGSMTDSDYGDVSRSEIDDCDRWSVLSTGPVDRQWTVVFTEKDEEL